MKKINLYAAICLLLGICLLTPSYAQLAKQKDINAEELSKHISTLVNAGTDSALTELKKEIIYLEQSDNEAILSLAPFVYEHALDNVTKAEELRASIAAKFPTGRTARGNAYNKVFEDPEKNTDPTVFEERLLAWRKAFPEESFPETDRSIYSFATQNLARHFARANATDKALLYLEELKDADNFAMVTYTVVNASAKEEIPKYNALIQHAYQVADKASKSDDEKIKKGDNARYKSALLALYANAILDAGDNEQTVSILKNRLEENEYAGYYANKDVEILTKAYLLQNKQNEAFDALEKVMKNNGVNPALEELSRGLFTTQKKEGLSFESYISDIRKVYKEQMTAKYEKEIINLEAPSFTLVNRDGKEVSLADYKGKVVVLDFWATWCGPCIVSFPGMQAAVTKFKDDKEVEFLFINTWQREKDYKELVEKFITDNKYTFHVLFDEMEERSKAVVTAFGVRGIPTKVVIDKNGMIRFQSAGGSDNVEEVLTEMEVKIGLAKKAS